MNTGYGVNQHYRQGPALLDRVAGYEGVVRYRRSYGPRIPAAAATKAERKNEAPAGGKNFFFFSGPEVPPDSIYETLLKTKPFAAASQIKFKPSPAAKSREDAGINRIAQKEDSPAAATGTGQKPALDGATPELFEHIDILESLLHAKDSVTMLSCGAGYGRSLAFANAMLRMLGTQLLTYFTALEPDPSVFGCLTEHMAFNNIACRNMELALSDHEGTEGFLSSAFRQKQNPSQDKKEYFLVKTVTLDRLLRESGYTDLVLMDIRHAETSVIPSSKLLTQNVRKAHVKIHSAHAGRQVRKRFDELNWINVWDFQDNCREETDFGPFSFQEGIQTWINPEFF